jgi:hypothetical protein
VQVAEGKTELRAHPFDLNLRNRPGAYEGVTLYTGKRSDSKQWLIERQGPNKTNYWVLRVPKQIIPGYGPIFAGESRDLMAALFRLAAAPNAAGRSVPVTVKGSAHGPVEKAEQHLQRDRKTGETVVTPAQPSGGEPPKPPP